MHELTRHYIEKFLELHRTSLHREFSFLKQKNQAYHQEEIPQLHSIVDEQRALFSRNLHHVDSFSKHSNLIRAELFPHDLSVDQASRLDNLIHR